MPSLTEKAICDSFLSLVSRKAIGRITVRDIVESCSINRNTFYYHFRDIYDVMDTVLMTGFRTEREQDTPPAEFFNKSLYDTLEFYMSHRDAVRGIYISVGEERFSRSIKAYFRSAIADYISAITASSPIPDDDRLLLAGFYAGGITGMICDWVKDGMRRDPRYVGVRMRELLRGCLKFSINNLNSRNNVK